MDVCGIVEGISPGVAGFNLGDIVVASNGMMPIGGLSQYMVRRSRAGPTLPPRATPAPRVNLASPTPRPRQLVKPAFAAHKPPGVPPLIAACCPTSAVTAYHAVRDSACVAEGERVLVLGGAGGVGSAAVQLAKLAGASFVATTTTQAAMLRSLGADDVIDYRAVRWWESRDYVEDPFDVVRDASSSISQRKRLCLCSRPRACSRARAGRVVGRGGRWCTMGRRV